MGRMPFCAGFYYYMKPRIYCQFDDKTKKLSSGLSLSSIVPGEVRNYNVACLHHGCM